MMNMLTTPVPATLKIQPFVLALLIVCAVLILLTLVYLFLIYPGRRREDRLKPLAGWDYAHRGLHGLNPAAPENSMKAFEAAVRDGYGAELDVQLTKDGQVVVFHDFDLKRMFGVDRKISELPYSDLSILRIPGSESGIPLFADVLKVFERRTPLIVEIKAGGDGKATCRKVDAVLSNYKGVYCVESFNPYVVGWYRKHRPGIVRGQLASDFIREKSRSRTIVKWSMTYLLLNFRNRPDFIAYNHVDSGNLSLRICRRLFRTFTVAWTVRSPEQYQDAKKKFDIVIFENFLPSKIRS
ncbi:MAG: glycerophosphodiester phosphodiesterase family protein [Saccharofermentanales bacterium]